jgi:phytanoyl-CoA hydroxylase
VSAPRDGRERPAELAPPRPPLAAPLDEPSDEPSDEVEPLEPVIARYRREGYAVLERALDVSLVTTALARIEAIMRGEVDPTPFFFQHDTTSGRYDDLTYGRGFVGPSDNYRKLEKLERDPVLRAFVEQPLFARIARRVLGEHVTLYRAIVMNKAARGPSGVGGTVLPWHQDGGALWGLDREPELQLWASLDDAPLEAGCLSFVPGTHHEGLVTRLGGMLPPERAAEAERRAVHVPTRAGDLVLLHNHVWHASGVNVTDRPRRALSVCLLRGDTRCVRKKRAPRAFVRLFQR